MFLISHSTPPEMYELHATSKNDRKTWMKIIQQTVSKSESVPIFCTILSTQFTRNIETSLNRRHLWLWLCSIYLLLSFSCPSREDFPLIETEDKALLRRLRGSSYFTSQQSLGSDRALDLILSCCLSSWHPAEGPWGFGAATGASDALLRSSRGHGRSKYYHSHKLQEYIQSRFTVRTSGWTLAERCHQWGWAGRISSCKEQNMVWKAQWSLFISLNVQWTDWVKCCWIPATTVHSPADWTVNRKRRSWSLKQQVQYTVHTHVDRKTLLNGIQVYMCTFSPLWVKICAILDHKGLQTKGPFMHQRPFYRSIYRMRMVEWKWMCIFVNIY